MARALPRRHEESSAVSARKVVGVGLRRSGGLMRKFLMLSLLLAGCAGGNDTCPNNQPDNCSGACVNTLSDHANCGGCGNACLDTQTCENGDCVNNCVPSAEECDGLDNNCD